MPAERLIFVGFELEDDVEKRLADCPERDRVYLKDQGFLEIAVIDGRRYIGKRTPSGAAIDRIEDTARNVVSMLVRVSKGWRAQASNALLIAVEESDLPDTPDEDGVTDDEESFDYSGLVD